MRELRGRWHIYNSIPLMITYHPAYLLRNQTPSEKRKVWEDMLQVLDRLERPVTEKQRNYFLQMAGILSGRPTSKSVRTSQQTLIPLRMLARAGPLLRPLPGARP